MKIVPVPIMAIAFCTNLIASPTVMADFPGIDEDVEVEVKEGVKPDQRDSRQTDMQMDNRNKSGKGYGSKTDSKNKSGKGYGSNKGKRRK